MFINPCGKVLPSLNIKVLQYWGEVISSPLSSILPTSAADAPCITALPAPEIMMVSLPQRKQFYFQPLRFDILRRYFLPANGIPVISKVSCCGKLNKGRLIFCLLSSSSSLRVLLSQRDKSSSLYGGWEKYWRVSGVISLLHCCSMP